MFPSVPLSSELVLDPFKTMFGAPEMVWGELLWWLTFTLG